MASLNIQDLKRSLVALAEAGRLDSSLIGLLKWDQGFAPVECDVLDYKEAVASDKLGHASIVADLVAFHNTYGGYLIIGVRETAPDIQFEACGIEQTLPTVEQLRDLSTSYTGTRLPITAQLFSLTDTHNLRHSVMVIHVAKRGHLDPIHFIKDGPKKRDGKLLFHSEDVFWRREDETLKATGKTIQFLFGPRPNPYSPSTENPLSDVATKKLLDHNLPDRAFICPSFVGRQIELERLWEWMADDLSHVRVLAGEGGLGKSSIAYQFAEEVCGEPLLGLEQVIWLTAKRQQFSAIRNEYIAVPETHFTTYDELLRVMCEKVASTTEEIANASEKGLKRLLQENAKLYPSMFVVDDIDSLPQQEQRKALELGFLLNESHSRLLATTRVNQSFSSDIAIQVAGFTAAEYTTFVDTVRRRYDLPQLTVADIQRMYGTTGGSPMYTESIYRLVRFSKPADAFRNWRSDQGEMARAAALSREIEQLSPEAKRVLLAAAYLKESSISELAAVSGYVPQAISDRLNELTALHLVSAPQITNEIRVRLSATTESFVCARADSLATDHTKLYARHIALRKEAKQVRTIRNNSMVGAAIDQAIGQLKHLDVVGAIDTIKTAEKVNPNHPDLLCMLARCYLRSAPPKSDEARRLARRAYEGGSRKDILFDVWYQAEDNEKHNVGVAEVASLAIEAGASPLGRWKERRAAASWEIARAQATVGNVDRAIEEYWQCDKDVQDLLRHATSNEASIFRATSERLHDEVWKLCSDISGSKATRATMSLDAVRKMLEAGDCRMVNYLRVCETVSLLADEFGRDSWPLTASQRNLAETRLREARVLIQQGCFDFQGAPKRALHSVIESFAVRESRLLAVLEKRAHMSEP